MKLENVLFTWFVITLTSVLLFAFTGIPLWSPLGAEGNGFVRFILLTIFHVGGFMAYPVSKI